MATCDRHEEVIEILEDHNKRINSLELYNVEVKTELKNLICTVKDLITWIKSFVGVVMAASIGFIIWYIQNN